MSIVAVILTSPESWGVSGLIVVLGAWALVWVNKNQKRFMALAEKQADKKSEDIMELEAKISALEEKHSLCEWRTEILLGVCRKGGLPIPDNYWTGPPHDRESGG